MDRSGYLGKMGMTAGNTNDMATSHLQALFPAQWGSDEERTANTAPNMAKILGRGVNAVAGCLPRIMNVTRFATFVSYSIFSKIEHTVVLIDRF